MNRPGRTLAAGWSFAAGTLFGVAAAFVVPTALHGSRPQAVAARAAETAPRYDLAPPVDLDASVVSRPQSAPASKADAKPQAPSKDQKSTGHSELDLQLD